MGGCLGPLRAAGRSHTQLSHHGRTGVALLAPGHDRLDGDRAARRGAGVREAAEVATSVSAAPALSTGMVLHRHLPARQLSARRRTGGALSERGDALDGNRVPPPLAEDRIARGRTVRLGVRRLGDTSPRLPNPASARRLESVGILPGYSFRAGDRRGDLSAGDGGFAPWFGSAGGAFRRPSGRSG